MDYCIWPLPFLKILYSFCAGFCGGGTLFILGVSYWGWELQQKENSLSSLITVYLSHPQCCQEMNEIRFRCYCFKAFCRLLSSKIISELSNSWYL